MAVAFMFTVFEKFNIFRPKHTVFSVAERLKEEIRGESIQLERSYEAESLTAAMKILERLYTENDPAVVEFIESLVERQPDVTRLDEEAWSSRWMARTTAEIIRFTTRFIENPSVADEYR